MQVSVSQSERDRRAAAAEPVRRATMRDVAALAGVSIKTVSRVINGVSTVSDDLRDRVTRAIAQLDFQPNLAASSLRRTDGATRQIALLLEDVANPFSATLSRAVENVAREHGTLVFTGSLDEEPQRELELVRAATLHRVDGIIIAPAAQDHGYLHREIRTGTPVVFVDRPPRGLVADSVLATNAEGAREAVLHLADHGHTEIAFLGDETSIATAGERLAGYRRALAERGLPERPGRVAMDLPDPETAARALAAMLDSDHPPQALFTAQNLVTIGAIQTLQERGLHQDVAVVGFDDFPMADLLVPRVSVVAQDVMRIGTLAVQRLFKRIAGDDGPCREERVPTTLIPRGSGEIPPPGR
ncbi:LacI family DNA-binding transcriptional regulator [Nocardiopsis sp. RSe5-2]|uniref:LacI family DNA-binding transcriptional regulator n=1 Tax=Nocardiopsis endophytica TaxID=3018445 RepID=A0ABT4TZM0_9ACTN|nr:LacI family DNA-binding transcriptional regulator [Nocardiopsis endophytica]MDA2810143.1 LacI family DNA-binding transcriptional regulator [Nocardiopsis endophytica]